MENVFNDYNTTTSVQVYKVESKDDYLKVEPFEDSIRQYPFFQNIRYITAFALTVALLQQPFLNLPIFKTSAEIQKNQIDFKDTTNIYENETSVFSSTSHINFPIEREGEFTLTDDVRQKDLDHLQESTDLKIEHLETKIDNVNDSINDIKVIMTRIENKIADLPSSDVVEKLISKNTNKFLIWLGLGLTATGGAVWAILNYYSSIIIELITM